jgi:hypothetical protein
VEAARQWAWPAAQSLTATPIEMPAAVALAAPAALFHPTVFDLTFTFSFGGMTQSFLDTNAMTKRKRG